MLKKYDESSILKINSNNAIQSNLNIVKELIDNSIDSGADSIILDIEEFGTKKITVIDNGKGIDKDIFDSLCIRGVTTKVNNISELNTLNTNGFRGQALSAISHLCDLQIITKSNNESSAYLLSFSNEGEIINFKHITENDFKEERKFWKDSQSGTIAIVNNVFKNNEIRRESVLKKKDYYFCEILNLVQAYAIINFNVRFDVFEKNDNKRNKIFQFENSQNIICKFFLIFYKLILFKKKRFRILFSDL